jgi:hypothetical protein
MNKKTAIVVVVTVVVTLMLADKLRALPVVSKIPTV